MVNTFPRNLQNLFYVCMSVVIRPSTQQKKHDSTKRRDSTTKARPKKKYSIVRFFRKFNLSLLLSFIVLEMTLRQLIKTTILVQLGTQRV